MSLNQELKKIKTLMESLNDSEASSMFIRNKLKKSTKIEFDDYDRQMRLYDDRGIVAVLMAGIYEDSVDVIVVDEKYHDMMRDFVQINTYTLVSTIYNYMRDLMDKEIEKRYNEERGFNFLVQPLRPKE